MNANKTNKYGNSKRKPRKGDFRGKGTGNGSRDFEKDSKCNTNRMEDVHSNNIEWWNRSPIFTDATSIQHNRFPGYIFSTKEDTLRRYDVSDPAVICYEYTPTIGVSTDYNSPVNRSFTSLYAQIVAHTNSSNLGFTQASLAMLAMAAASIVTNLGAAKRAYGLKNLYLNQNANFPRVLYRACGFNDYDGVQWEQIRVRLNTLISDFNSLMLPKYVSLYDRAFQLSYNIYADEDSVMANTYVFKPVTYYVYRDTENETVSKDIPRLQNLDELLDIIHEQLLALRSTSDLGLIMGAYRRAFPESDTLRFELVPVDAVTIPWYDRNMTWQINNMSIVPQNVISDFDIQEDVVKDILTCRPAIVLEADEGGNQTFNTTQNVEWYMDGDTLSARFYNSPIRLNSFNGDLSPEFIMEATRLLVVPDGYGTIKACGTEVVHAAYCYDMVLYSNGIEIQEHPFEYALTFPLSNDERYALYAYTKFRNAHPWGYHDGMSEEDESEIKADLRDYYITTSVSASEVAQLHEAALQSCYLLNVPTRW